MKTSIALAGILLAGTSIISAQAINGAGATFPYPIYGKWFEEFRQKNPSIEINYRSEEHTSELQSLRHLVCRLLLEKKKKNKNTHANRLPCTYRCTVYFWSMR